MVHCAWRGTPQKQQRILQATVDEPCQSDGSESLEVVSGEGLRLGREHPTKLRKCKTFEL